MSKEYAFRVVALVSATEKEFKCKKAAPENSEPLEQNKLRKEILRHICFGANLQTLLISATIDREVAAIWRIFFMIFMLFYLRVKMKDPQNHSIAAIAELIWLNWVSPVKIA